MGKEKQIEDMARITKVHCKLDNQCGSCHWETCNDCFAEILYNAGYRRQSENMVEVVRCKDCYYCEKLSGVLGTSLYCSHWCKDVDDDTFCSNGFSMKGGAE